jgi:hypothetical protein
MKDIAKAKTTLDQIVLTIRTLEQLSRRIDNEARQSIRRTRKWYLERGRADWIVTQSLQRIHSVDLVIRELNQWKSALETSARLTNHENSTNSD